jgi:hypothetical protein
MKTKDPREISEKNYVKLWWISQVNAPFRYARDLIREKWRSLDNVAFAKAVTIMEELKPPQQLVEANILLESQLILNDITFLAQEFNFEDFWLPYLVVYILTGKILAPLDKLSKKITSQHVLRMRKVFLWRVKEWNQKEKLKKQGYKTRRRDPDNAYVKGKYMDELSAGKKILSEALIRKDENIADILFEDGKEDIDSVTKKVNLIKKDMERLKKELIPLSPQDKRKLDKIFS